MTYQYYRCLSLSLFILIIFSGCSSLKQPPQANLAKEAAAAEETYVIKHVNVIPMSTADSIIKNAVVVIKKDKIFSINGAVPDNAKVIDGKDKWLSFCYPAACCVAGN